MNMAEQISFLLSRIFMACKKIKALNVTKRKRELRLASKGDPKGKRG
ncbi:hypothetical protein HF313_14655 [Massilia atriviolacea]|nr:hypothetical protein [Massilia atriviolacea]